MKNYFFLFLCFPLFIAACKKTETCNYTESLATATAGEVSYLQNYINANSIIATKHSSGVFYSITNPGTGLYPNICSKITVKYAGYILGGNRFDSSANANLVLGDLIPSWQKTIPLLKSGGSIVLYMPPSLAYGAREVKDGSGNIIIPANSYLKFNIELLEVH